MRSICTRHAAVVEHSDGRALQVPLAPDRPVAEVTRELLSAVNDLAGAVHIDPRPQETPWTTPLDEDYEHATYNPAQVADYFAAATQAALVLAALRAPYRGRSSPVNAWWGSFDLAVSLFSGHPVEPPSNDFIMRNSGNAQQIEVGWWPGDARHASAAFYGFAFPAPDGFGEATLKTPGAHWDADPRRVPPRLGRRAQCAGASQHSARLLPRGRAARVLGVRLGSHARGQC